MPEGGKKSQTKDIPGQSVKMEIYKEKINFHHIMSNHLLYNSHTILTSMEVRKRQNERVLT